jgi:hypothetical protein
MLPMTHVSMRKLSKRLPSTLASTAAEFTSGLSLALHQLKAETQHWTADRA